MKIAEADAKTFTMEEASLLLPRIRSLVGVLVEANAATLAEARGNAPPPGNAAKSSSELLRQAVDAQSSLAALGVLVKDDQLGMVDFLSVRGGSTVELCWMLGENEIGYWHEVGAGFRRRRPL